MAILQLPTPLPAQVGIFPTTKKMVVTNTLAQLITPGFLNAGNLQGFSVNPTDVLEVTYNANIQTMSGDLAILTVKINNGVITLVPDTSEGNVVLPVTTNNIAVFADATGKIKQTPTDGSITATTYGNLFVRGGASGQALISMESPGGANGVFAFQPSSNSGAFTYLVTNDAIASNSQVVTMVDPGTGFGYSPVIPWNGSVAPLTSGNMLKSSSAKGRLVDAGYAIIAKTTAVYAGGGTSNTFAATGLTASSIVTANILTSTNNVSITKVVPGTNTLAITFSADPGANTTVNYIATTAQS